MHGNQSEVYIIRYLGKAKQQVEARIQETAVSAARRPVSE